MRPRANQKFHVGKKAGYIACFYTLYYTLHFSVHQILILLTKIILIFC